MHLAVFENKSRRRDDIFKKWIKHRFVKSCRLHVKTC